VSEASEQALQQALDAELRLLTANLKADAVELDFIRFAMVHGAMDTQQAIRLSNPIVNAYTDRPRQPDPYIEEFCALVEQKRAEYEEQQKRRRRRRRSK
jgi:hypothetical protein